MPERDELLRQRVVELVKEADAATTVRYATEVIRAKSTERDVALAAWVAAERSLEVLAEASTDGDDKYSTAEYLAVAFAEYYLAAKRALGCFRW